MTSIYILYTFVIVAIVAIILFKISRISNTEKNSNGKLVVNKKYNPFFLCKKLEIILNNNYDYNNRNKRSYVVLYKILDDFNINYIKNDINDSDLIIRIDFNSNKNIKIIFFDMKLSSYFSVLHIKTNISYIKELLTYSTRFDILK